MTPSLSTAARLRLIGGCATAVSLPRFGPTSQGGTRGCLSDIRSCQISAPAAVATPFPLLPSSPPPLPALDIKSPTGLRLIAPGRAILLLCSFTAIFQCRARCRGHKDVPPRLRTRAAVRRASEGGVRQLGVGGVLVVVAFGNVGLSPSPPTPSRGPSQPTCDSFRTPSGVRFRQLPVRPVWPGLGFPRVPDRASRRR